MVKKIKGFFRRIPTVFICFLLILSISVGTIYREPVVVANATGVEAVLGGLAAGATGVGAAPIVGGLIVAAAATAIGIGVSAAVTGKSYSEVCQNVWNRLSDSVKQGFVVAGTAAHPIIQASQQAIVGTAAAFQSVWAQRSSYESAVSYGLKTFSIPGTVSMSNISTSLGFQYPITLVNSIDQSMTWIGFYGDPPIDPPTVSNIRVLGTLTATTPLLLYPLTSGAVISLNVEPYSDGSPDTTFNLKYWKAALPDSSSYINSMDYLSRIRNYYGPQNHSCFPVLVSMLINGTYTIGVLLGDQVGNQSAMYIFPPKVLSTGVTAPSTDAGYNSIDDGVINAANDTFYAKELSALNTKIDDLEARLEEAQGKTPGTGVDLNPPAVPYVPTADDDYWDEVRRRTQPQVLNVPGSIATPEDKTRDDATNVDRDTTAVPDDTEDTPSSNPGSTPSTPSKITDITGGIPQVVSGVDNGFSGINDLLQYLSEFFKFLAKGFSLLPGQLAVVFISVVVIVVVVRILGRGTS